jgi:hypothetical protein
MKPGAANMRGGVRTETIHFIGIRAKTHGAAEAVTRAKPNLDSQLHCSPVAESAT